jgi:hypothetical protein
MMRDSTIALEDTFAAAVRRVKADYLEMPGLKLTSSEAAKLWGLEVRMCDAVLTALVADRFLMCTMNAAFVRQD